MNAGYFYNKADEDYEFTDGQERRVYKRARLGRTPGRKGIGCADGATRQAGAHRMVRRFAGIIRAIALENGRFRNEGAPRGEGARPLRPL